MSMQVVFDNRNRPARTIPAKWHPLIWVMLVVISLFRSAVEVAADIAAAEGAAEIILSLLSAVVFSGGIPALLCYCCGLVLYTMSARRGYFFCHRDDFVYLVMLFTAGSRFVVGVINCFSFLEPAVGIYTSLAADVAVLPAAMFAMYFGVLAPRFMNPRTRADIFAMYGGMFFLLLGIFTVITYYTGFRAGFSFSAGATDLVFSASLPAAEKTWMIIPLGIGAAVVFFVVFYALIKAFNFKTPGREDDDENTDAEKKVVLANNNYTQVAAGVLAAVGGKGNVKNVEYCATRLRFEIKDYTAVDEKAVKAAGAAGVIRPSKNACQVIIGTKVQFVYDELKKML